MEVNGYDNDTFSPVLLIFQLSPYVTSVLLHKKVFPNHKYTPLTDDQRDHCTGF